MLLTGPHTGRTARIGNEGIATSLYNHYKNSDIAEDLVKVLLENMQSIPDFLESVKPPGELVFDDNSEDEAEAAPEATPEATSEAASEAEESTSQSSEPDADW